MRLHLVRFMFINLLLRWADTDTIHAYMERFLSGFSDCSCCFWLYDNVAAADSQIPSRAGGSAKDAARKTHIEPEEPAAPPRPEPPPPPLHNGAGVLLPSAQEGVPIVATSSSSSFAEVPQTGNRPISGDTSVPVKELPALSDQQRAKSHSEYISEIDLAADVGGASSSTAQVPNNQLNYNKRGCMLDPRSISSEKNITESMTKALARRYTYFLANASLVCSQK